MLNFYTKEGALYFNLEYGNENIQINFELPENSYLVDKEDPDYPCITDGKNKRWVTPELLLERIHRLKTNIFDVLYIGQAYGKDGSRNARDRLLSHEKLQKISLTHNNDKKSLHVLMLEVEPNNQVVTLFNPNAQDTATDKIRIKKGIDKLYATSKHEQISLFEAAFIRFFEPKFNKDSPIIIIGLFAPIIFLETS